jgi:hypothetical protein
MKKAILFLFMAATFTSHAQSLKDLLYSGKLKMDSNTVIRKTDDLSSKIDTSQKKSPDQVKATVITTTIDTTVKINNTKADNTKSNPAVTNQPVPVTNQPTALKDTAIGEVTGAAAAATGNENVTTNTEAPAPAAAPAKTNNKIWKEYTDSLAGPLKTEVMSSKKIKKDTYFFMVDYDLAPDGSVTITNVTVSPENKTLQEQVKMRMDAAGAPQMNAIPNSTPTTKKAKRRYSFSITKD